MIADVINWRKKLLIVDTEPTPSKITSCIVYAQRVVCVYSYKT